MTRSSSEKKGMMDVQETLRRRKTEKPSPEDGAGAEFQKMNEKDTVEMSKPAVS